MKKILKGFLILLMLSFLIGCSKLNQIKNNLYITTVALEKDVEKDEFIVYVYYIASQDAGKNENVNDNAFGVLKGQDKNLIQAFNHIERGITQKLEYSTIKSFLFHDNFMSESNMELFNSMLKKMMNITYNFYMFYTSESIESLFSTKNPDNISSLFNLFSNPKANEYLDSNVKPLHFLEYVRFYHLNFIGIKFPMIGLSNIYLSEVGEPRVTTQITGVCYYHKNKKVIFTEKEEKGFFYILNHQNLIIYKDDFNVSLRDYKYKIKYQDNQFLVKISFEMSIIDNRFDKTREEILELIKRELKEHIEIVLKISDEFKIDFLNLNYLLYKKNQEHLQSFSDILLHFEITNKNY